ncbi:hypothetical protein [Spongiibacter marinus]|uniref:hypothetical protein n=1 Tax=Spongiibacter marinus TaxID=354246 RepID=UPI000480F479|nr:hypothetical protein [Spongiibacter marinus]
MTMTRSNNIYEEQYELSMEMFYTHLMKKTHLSFAEAHERHVRAHYERGLHGKPISKDTFRRWFQRNIPQRDRLKAQVGAAAVKEFDRCVQSETPFFGFMARALFDGFVEPIKLLSSYDFSPLKHSPRHIFAVEGETTAFMGLSTNYYTGSESSEFVLECIKSAFFGKTGIQETYGTQNPWPVRGRVFECVMDAGTAFNNGNVDRLLDMMFVGAMLTRTRTPEDKALIEVINGVVKRQFTLKLDGSYDDTEDKSLHEKVTPVLTELEHSILLHRYIIDKFNQAINSSNREGLTRTAHWEREAMLLPPTMPANPIEAKNFIGEEQTKTIMLGKGIQIKVGADFYKYNNRELQRLARDLSGEGRDQGNRKVSIKWAITKPDSIQVKNPITDEIMTIPRINRDASVERSELARRQLLINPAYFDMQDINILSCMTDAEIKAHARQRAKDLRRSATETSHRNAAISVAVDIASARQEAQMEEALRSTRGVPETTVFDHENESAEEIESSQTTPFPRRITRNLYWE